MAPSMHSVFVLGQGSASAAEASFPHTTHQQPPLVGGFFVLIDSDPGRQHPVTVLPSVSPAAALLDPCAGCALVGQGSSGSPVMARAHPGTGTHVDRLRPREEKARSAPQPSWPCHRRFHDPMDDATRRHWEEIAGRCFDRAYRTVLRQVTPKPANGQVPGPRAAGS
jgi:hypothetical protein